MTQSTIPFACTVSTSDTVTPLHLQILLDNVEVYNSQVTQKADVAFVISDDEGGEHELQFVMSGKTHQHTKIDEQGNILSDVLLELRDIVIDGIDISNMFYSHARYTHDFNGTQPQTTTTTHGSLGCNGVVSLKFSSPFYLWLLENM